MKHLDLFSGIGGFALAVDTVWPGSKHVFVEIDPFCQEVLKKHWPNSQIHDDIRTFTHAQHDGFHGAKNTQGDRKGKNRHAERQKKLRQLERGDTIWPQVDLLTGGFPCQPFSQAGRKRGTEDDRHLWPEMLRVIKEFKPTWIIGENVAGIVNMVLEQVCLDLEAEGYEVQPIIIPAVAVNAPHRRDRVWIIAHSTSRGQRSSQPERDKQGQPEAQTRDNNSDASDTRRTRTGSQKEPERSPSDVTGWSWSGNWTKIAAQLCRVDDGIPKRLDRNPRLKALGNAIVPQVAEEIIRAISTPKELEERDANRT